MEMSLQPIAGVDGVVPCMDGPQVARVLKSMTKGGYAITKP
jgi:hypothetical protein